MNELTALHQKIEQQNTLDSLKVLTEEFRGEVVFSTSFGLEGLVVLDMICRHDLPVEVFTIDTGRLFEESRELFDKVRNRYNKEIKVYFPNQEKVEKLTREKGHFSFYKSVENRTECCHIRKVEPLQRALKGKKLWITGLRNGQSEFRSQLEPLHWDKKNNILKFCPLLSWSQEAVEEYLDAHQLPYNRLRDKGYLSIGCAPCTRAIQPGDDLRSGRWWWEQSHKECGLHL